MNQSYRVENLLRRQKALKKKWGGKHLWLESIQSNANINICCCSFSAITYILKVQKQCNWTFVLQLMKCGVLKFKLHKVCIIISLGTQADARWPKYSDRGHFEKHIQISTTFGTGMNQIFIWVKRCYLGCSLCNKKFSHLCVNWVTPFTTCVAVNGFRPNFLKLLLKFNQT